MSQELDARRLRDALKALKSLESAGFPARLAGGCVRDRLRGVIPKDYDVATVATPEEVTRHFATTGGRTVPTGIAHGTVTLVTASGPVEITTLRLDVATDGRHAQVAFGKSFEDDAARRDFTINAMFEDAAGVIYDFYGGRDDLDAGVLRFVGAPAARIREDYLRIMRLFRFWARFGYAPAAGTLAAVQAEAAGISRVSQERITAELLGLFDGDHAEAALQGMRQSGVLPLVLPELDAQKLAAPGAALWSVLRAAPPSHRALATLATLAMTSSHFTPAAAEALGQRLKLRTSDTRALSWLAALPQTLTAPFADVAARLGFVDASDAQAGDDSLATLLFPVLTAVAAETPAAAALLTQLQAIQRDEERYGHLRRAKLPLGGAQLMRELGLGAGPALGEAVETLRRGFRNSEWQTADEGLQWLRAKLSTGK